MLMTHRNGRRLAVLTGLCVALALGAATHVAAYPITPDGEPLYLDRGAPQSSTTTPMPNELGDLKREWLAMKSSKPIDPLPATIVTSSGTDWGGVFFVVAGASLAALALIAAAFVLNGHRRRSAGAHSREESIVLYPDVPDPAHARDGSAMPSSHATRSGPTRPRPS